MADDPLIEQSEQAARDAGPAEDAMPLVSETPPGAGTWDDDVLGWSDELGPMLRAHVIADGHVEVMFHPEAVAILTAELDRAHARRGRPDAR